jgi:hypothetical protein
MPTQMIVESTDSESYVTELTFPYQISFRAFRELWEVPTPRHNAEFSARLKRAKAFRKSTQKLTALR